MIARHEKNTRQGIHMVPLFRLFVLAALFSMAAVNVNRSLHCDPMQAGEFKPPGYESTAAPINYSLDFINLKNRIFFGYSGVWWMNREEFLKINIARVDFLEAATFVPFERVFGLDRVLMTRDWLDFSVEHLSRYFRMIDNSDFSSFQRKIEMLRRYMGRIASKGYKNDSSAAANTIAIVPFYINPGQLTESDLVVNGSTKIPLRGAVVDLYSLAATLLSLWKVGIPRIVVVGNAQPTPPQVAQAFALCLESINMVHQEWTDTSEFSLNYVHAHNIQRIEKKGSSYTTIMPRHAIDNLQQAMVGNLTNASNFLGSDPSRWKFVYFTENDLILHSRTDALPALSDRMEAGFAIAAHRFQPLPHIVDYPNHTWRGQLLPSIGNLGSFHDLNAETDACCYIGDFQPGRANLPSESCRPGNWYGCGLGKRLPNNSDAVNEYYQRLSHYPMIRLVDGLLVPLVNEHARVCVPSKRGTCSQRIP